MVENYARGKFEKCVALLSKLPKPFFLTINKIKGSTLLFNPKSCIFVGFGISSSSCDIPQLLESGYHILANYEN